MHYTKIIAALVSACIIVLTAGVPCNGQNETLDEIKKFIQKEQFEKGITALNAFISHNPDTIDAYLIKGELYLKMGTVKYLEDSKQAFSMAIARRPQDIDLYKRIAFICHQNELYKVAMEFLEQAFRIDSQNHSIIERLANYYIHERLEDKVQSLRDALDKSFQEHQNDTSLAYWLAKLNLELEYPKKSIEILTMSLDREPHNSKLQQLLADAYLWNQEGDEFTRAYIHWLEMEKDETVLYREYELTKLSMKKKDIELFESLSYKDKPQFLIKFWNSNDEYPVTIQNERLIEFRRRVTFAESFYFSYQELAGFGNIGKFIVRLGIMPELGTRVVDQSVTKEQVGRRQYTYQYARGQMDQRLRYLPKAKYDWNIYRSFNTWRPDAAFQKNGVRDPSLKFAGGVQTLSDSKYAELLSGEPFYKIELAIPKLEFSTRSAQFRGDSGKTRIDVAFGVPIDKLAENRQDISSALYLFETNLIMFDSLSNRNVQINGIHEYEYITDKKEERPVFTGEESGKTIPGDFKMCFQVIEAGLKKGDFVFEPVHVRDFSGSDLMVSDIKLCRSIELPGDKKEMGPDSLRLAPFSFPSVKRNQNISLYFEIYNLLVEPEKGSDFSISIAVSKKDRAGNFAVQSLRSLGRIFAGGKAQTIESIYKRKTQKPTSLEFIELNLSSFKPGYTRLTVTVHDLLRDTKAESSVDFELLK